MQYQICKEPIFHQCYLIQYLISSMPFRGYMHIEILLKGLKLGGIKEIPILVEINLGQKS